MARALREQKHKVAVEVTESFLRRHPDWLTRYGERARTAGIEDATYHVEFLATAVEAGSPAAFTDYVRWTRRVLEARGIAARFLAENLDQIEKVLASVVSPTAATSVSTYMAPAREACVLPEAATHEDDSDGPLALTRRLFVDAILGGQRTAAMTVAVEALQQGATIVDLYAEVFQGALHEIGRRWEANRITVADEHMATAIAQHVLGQIYARLELPRPTRGRLLIAGVPGELHQLGANMVADILEAHGWDVRFLGTNCPRSSILAAVEKHAPSVVGLSATMLTSLPAAAELLAAIRRLAGRQVRLIVGGAAFRASDAALRDWGADLFVPDVRAAVQLLCPPALETS